MSLRVRCQGEQSHFRLAMEALGILQLCSMLLLFQLAVATAFSYADSDDLINELDRPGE